MRWIRRWRLPLALVLLLGVAGNYAWTICQSPENRVRLGLWSTPIVERTISTGDTPVLAVGGSREAQNLIVGVGLTWDPEPTVMDEMGVQRPDNKNAVYLKRAGRAPEALKLDYAPLIRDVDIGGDDDPSYIVASRGAIWRGRPSEATRREGGSFCKAAFSPSETAAAFGGGYFRGGDLEGYVIESSMLFLDSERGNDLDRVSRVVYDIGVSSVAWSPDGKLIVGVGIDTVWAQGKRRLNGGPTSGNSWAKAVEGLEPLPTIVAWDGEMRDPKAWEQRIAWQIRDRKRPIRRDWKVPAFCRFTADGRRIVVGWGAWKENPRFAGNQFAFDNEGPLRSTFETVEMRSAADGGLQTARPIAESIQKLVFAMEVVGVLREEIIAVTRDALWRQPIDGGEWTRFEIPDAGDITVVKTTRDRKHLLVGDNRGAVHVLRWP